ncbi:MAG: UbiD family decarboxylase [Desulforudis sp.]|jgi:4-hydroxy-3-polyprenylbenzoate decarboxylase|nr:MAG: UbiD family decarboxylase [Desulforudis sp.]
MGYDLRDFLTDLKKAGELVEIDEEVDWNYEISAYEVISGRFDGPAFLFNKIKGIQPGPRVAASIFSGSFRRPHKRNAICFGIDPGLDRVGWFTELARRMSSMLRPVEVATGPCKEVVKMGKDVNLLEFPFTYHAIGEGGRYIFSNTVIIKDPDSGWINSGNYAIEVFSRNRLVIAPYAHTNFVSIYNTKYQLRGQSMPVAVCLGGDPAVTMAAGMILPPGVTEYDVAGGLRGAPIELVRAETSDLLVPANAEVIIEGEIRPYERLLEGPKIEAFGFSTGPRQPFYAIRVHCITHRKDPIIPDLHTAVGAGCNALHDSFGHMGYLGQIKALGLPIKFGCSVSIPRTGATASNAVIKQKYPEDYPGFMKDLFQKVLGQPGMGGVLACNLFVDDDVNILDYGEFYEAMFTQTNPARDVIKSAFKYPVMTLESSWMEEEDRTKFFGPGSILSHKLIIDATTKEEPPLGVRRLAFETLFPAAVQEWVVQNWEKLGFTEEARWNKSWLETEF